jgi:hypothetical protein
MGESVSSVVELDEEVQKLFNNYNKLISANNELQLNSVPPFEPFKPAPDTNVIPYSTKVQELAEKVHKAAAQLKTHYDRVANEDAGFIPYWNQDPTFTQACDNLPKLRPIGWFENFRKYCGRLGLEERLALDKQLDYFTPFFRKSLREERVKSFDELNKEYHKRDITNTIGTAAIPSITAFFVYMSCFSSEPPVFPEKALLTFRILSGAAAGGFVFLQYLVASLAIKDHPTTVFKYGTCGSLKCKAEQADKMVSLIKTLSE